jgi:hypothetical protein
MSRSELQLDVHECERRSEKKGLTSTRVSGKLAELQPGCRSLYTADHSTLVTLLEWLAEVRRAGFDTWVANGLPECTAEAIIIRHPRVFTDARLRARCERRLTKYAPTYPLGSL